MKNHYNYIVLGCGGLGSATCYWLARRAGSEVLGIEQFPLGHSRGGSQDYSRVIRLTYNLERYTRLALHTYSAWAVLEKESAVQIVTKTGGVQAAFKASPHLADIEAYASAMSAANVPFERFGGDELRRRFPQFRFESEVEVLYQSDTGIVDPSKGNASHIAMARLYGATIRDQCAVREIRPKEGGVGLDTECGKFSCRHLVIAAGAWTDRVVTAFDMSLGLTVTQEQVTYFATPHLAQFAIGRFPLFFWHADEFIYGFPVYGEVATKAAYDAVGRVVTADTRTYDPDPEMERRLETWLQRHIPNFVGPKLYTKTCLYTMPRDRDFVIDSLPHHPNITVCVGAGHAYKFACLVGKILSELAIDGRTGYPIAPFTLQRPAITDSSYPLSFHI